MTGRADMIRKVLAVVAVLVLIGLVAVLSFDDRTSRPMPPNGDMLGMDPEQSFAQYRAHAEASLMAAPVEEQAFALVTFTGETTPEVAAGVLEPVGRVNAMLISLAAPFPLPEPVAGENRADVFDRELARISHSLSGVGDVPTPEGLDAVIIWENGQTLRTLAEEGNVATVEALPPDAAWGRFGVRPVQLDQSA